MSVLVKDGKYYKLYIKGADNIIKDKLNKKVEQKYKENAEEKLL